VDRKKAFGVLLDSAPQSGQVLPLNSNNFAKMELRGRWERPESADLLGRSGCQVEARVVEIFSGKSPSLACDWQELETQADGRFSGALESIPVGGPYRLETRLQPRGNKTREWGWRGDQRTLLYAGDVFLIAGQSNAAGYGEGDGQDSPCHSVQTFTLGGTWRQALHPLADSTNSLWPGLVQDHNTGHSPWIAFGEEWVRKTGRPVGFIPMAVGGTSLDFWSEGGEGFSRMPEVVQAAGAFGKLKGILWAQGESDAKGDKAEDYELRWRKAMQGWHQELGQSELSIFAVQLGRYYSRNPGADDEAWSLIREAQRKCSQDEKYVDKRVDAYFDSQVDTTAYSEANREASRGVKTDTVTKADARVLLFPALDLEVSDAIHWSPGGNRKLGQRMAARAAEWLLQLPGPGPTPTLQKVQRVKPNLIRLTFRNIRDRLDALDPKAVCFTVWAGGNSVPLTGIRYDLKNSVDLMLEEVPEGPLTVSAGHGENPPLLPLDMGRRIPILAFHRVSVENVAT
jgi:hypothetical protein